MQCIHKQVKPLLLNKAKTKQIHFCFTDIFLNINCLLRIACTIPVTSADNKGGKGTALKLVKGYHHDNRKTVRLGYDEHSLRNAH